MVAGAVPEEGTCVAVNDRPTCDCDSGNVAVLDEFGTAVRCVPISGGVFESDQLLYEQPLIEASEAGPTGPAVEREARGCSAPRGDRAGGLASIALLLLAGAIPPAWRRLRRR